MSPTSTLPTRSHDDAQQAPSQSSLREIPSCANTSQLEVGSEADPEVFSSSATPNDEKPLLSEEERNEAMRRADAAVLQSIRDGLIGEGAPIETPFGSRKLVYCDYVASGRALTQVEDYIRDAVLPMYANTHTSSSATGRQMHIYREEARATIAKAVNAGKDDAVIFTGSGSTAAMNMMVQVLKQRRDFVRPLIVLGPYEHNSNLLPWRELKADVVCIREAREGGVDLKHLERVLKKASRKQMKIGSFSAASNVSGALSDTVAITKMLRSYGALAFFDYAAAAPYVPIDMNPTADAAKDAVFISTHKFVGGVGAPGVLVVKRALMDNTVPTVPAGGTVDHVDQETHAYVRDIESREEGGTPDIVGSIRAGCAFGIKASVGPRLIGEREHEIAQLVMQRLQAHPNVLVLGSADNRRLPTFSFMIRHHDVFLHHDFVSVLLNDLFGIQSRAGCACAGAYSMFLLGINQNGAHRILANESLIVKPGFTRFNLPYFASDETVEFVMNSVLFVAEHGWKFLPHYRYDSSIASWICRADDAFQSRTMLGMKSMKAFSLTMSSGNDSAEAPASNAECLERAHEALQRVVNAYPTNLADDEDDGVPDELCWYLRSNEALHELHDPSKAVARPVNVIRPRHEQQEPVPPIKFRMMTRNPMKKLFRSAALSKYPSSMRTAATTA